jgi:hypothetical protein
MKRGVVLCAIAIACSAHRAPKPAAPVALAPAHIEVRVDARDPHAVRAIVHVVNGASASIVFEDETIHGVASYEVLRSGAWVALDPKKPNAPECVTDCTLRYAIDLAQVERSFEGVVAVGPDAFLAPSPSWLVRPDPMPRGDYDITIEGAKDATPTFTSVPFATGLRRTSPDHFTLPTNDFYEGSFAAFGRVRHRTIQAAGSTLEIAVLSDTELALKDDEIAQWVKGDAECVAQLYGHFSVPRATIFIVPIDGAREVVFGKVLSLGGASVIALTGTRFESSDTHGDWVLVHEMTHLGFPTMGIRWLTEGLATYYEPILRTRAGWLTPKSVWSALARSFPRGVPPEGAELALDKRDSIDDVYWGGALFVFMTDVAIRKATSNRKSFDDVMRAVLAAGGDATVSWTLDQVLDVAKRATGTNVVSEMIERFAVRGERIDLARELADLGIARGADGQATLDDHAPNAAIRKSIDGSTR